MNLGKNCVAEVHDGGKSVTLKVDLSKTYGESSTGRSTTVAAGQGNLGKSGIRVGLNAYMKLGNSFNKEGLKGVTLEGRNMDISFKGTIMTVKVLDLEDEGVASKGNTNTILIASTHGNKKLGTTNIMVGINITKKGPIDISKIAEDPGMNMVMKKSDDELVVTVDCTQKMEKSKTGKMYLLASSKEGIPLSNKEGATKVMLNVTCKDTVPTIPNQTKCIPNKQAKGITYSFAKDVLKFYIDLTGDYGPSTGEANTIVASTNGKMDHSNVSAGIHVYKPIPGAKRKAPEEKEKEDKPKKTKPVAEYEDVKAGVAQVMNDAAEDVDLTVGTIRRELARVHGWADDGKLKELVKKAIKEIQAEEDDEEEEPKKEKKSKKEKRSDDAGDEGTGPSKKAKKGE